MKPRSYVEHLQDDDVVRLLIERQGVLEQDRAPWENIWRQIERRVDPIQMGGFNRVSPGQIRGEDIFDSTAAQGVDRYEAAIAGITLPRNQRWHGLVTTNPELNKLPEVQRWCEYGTDRLFAMRYAPAAGFEVQAYENIRSGGVYGTQPLWVDEWVGRGLFYKAFHLSEIWIDENFHGRIDTVHRKFTRTLRQILQEYGEATFSPKMMQKKSENKLEAEFELTHVIRPNGEFTEGKWDWQGKPIESITLVQDEKWIMRRSGYYTMPALVSRTSTSPRDKYGRSPAMKVLPTIKSVNEMAKTILRAGHKAVDPPILFHDDNMITKFISSPGGLNPGLVDENGRILAHPFQGAENLPIGLELINAEREVIKDGFLEKVFATLFERGDRMTATEVLEVARQQGVLAAPTAVRIETEWLGPQIERELDIGLRAGQIMPPPPVMREADANLKVIYLNPLARMARAEEASGFAQWSEMLIKIAPFDQNVIDLVDTDAAARGTAEVLGVRPSWIATPDQVAAKRAQRDQEKAQASLLAGAQQGGEAALNIAKANQIASGPQ